QLPVRPGPPGSSERPGARPVPGPCRRRRLPDLTGGRTVEKPDRQHADRDLARHQHGDRGPRDRRGGRGHAATTGRPGRPRTRSGRVRGLPRHAIAGALLAGALLAAPGAIPAVAAGGAGAPAANAAGPPGQTPVFCYYYIWFDPPSWNRAKIDYPAVGRYSSSDPDVMRQQIGEAKAAGITAFLVSWKGTPAQNARL